MEFLAPVLCLALLFSPSLRANGVGRVHVAEERGLKLERAWAARLPIDEHNGNKHGSIVRIRPERSWDI